MMTVLSDDPEASWSLLLGLHATLVTARVCPLSSVTFAPEAASQMMTVLSDDPEARWSPLGLHATLQTSSVCPLSVDT